MKQSSAEVLKQQLLEQAGQDQSVLDIMAETVSDEYYQTVYNSIPESNVKIKRNESALRVVCLLMYKMNVDAEDTQKVLNILAIYSLGTTIGRLDVMNKVLALADALAEEDPNKHDGGKASEESSIIKT